MARIVKYMILLWNHINFQQDHEELPLVLEHYQRLKGELPPKSRTLYEWFLTEHLTPAFSSEGVTMEKTL